MERNLKGGFGILAGPGAAQRARKVMVGTSLLAMAAAWEDTQEKIQFLPGISGFDSLPEHSPAPQQARASFFPMKQRSSAKCSNNVLFSIPLLSEEPLGMAGKERDLKIAADALCSWRSSPEHRNPKIEQTFPFPIPVARKGLG